MSSRGSTVLCRGPGRGVIRAFRVGCGGFRARCADDRCGHRPAHRLRRTQDRDRIDLGRGGRAVSPDRRLRCSISSRARSCGPRPTATSSPPTAAPPTCRPGSPTRRTTTSRVNGKGEIVTENGRARCRRRRRRRRTTEDPAAAGRRRGRGGASRAQPDRLRPVARRVPADRHPDRAPAASRGDERARRDRRRRSRRPPTSRSRGRSPTRPRGPARSSRAARILMAIGVFLYILGIRHARRSRGPRRKGLPLPVTEPIDLAVAGEDKGVISAGPPRVAPSPAVVGRSPSCPSSRSPRCCSRAARRTRGRSSGQSATPTPTADRHRSRGSAGAGRHEGPGRAHHRARSRRRPRQADEAQGRGARRDASRRRRAGGPRDELRAARCDRGLQGARRRSSPSLSRSCCRRRTTAGRGR